MEGDSSPPCRYGRFFNRSYRLLRGVAGLLVAQARRCWSNVGGKVQWGWLREGRSRYLRQNYYYNPLPCDGEACLLQGEKRGLPRLP